MLYCRCVMQVKQDKWSKLVSQEENVTMINDFLEKSESELLVISLTAAGQLQPATKVCVDTCR